MITLSNSLVKDRVKPVWAVKPLHPADVEALRSKMGSGVYCTMITEGLRGIHCNKYWAFMRHVPGTGLGHTKPTLEGASRFRVSLGSRVWVPTPITKLAAKTMAIPFTWSPLLGESGALSKEG